MLQLKRFTVAEGEQAYAFLQTFAQDENGPKDQFLTQELPRILAHVEGKMLKENHVPETWFFLWDDDQMVGLFRIRHYLTEALAQGRVMSAMASILLIGGRAMRRAAWRWQ